MSRGGNAILAEVTIRCPICGRERSDVPDDFPHRPFCSKRCKTIDLGNWLSESYRFSRPIRAGNDDVDDEFELS